MNAKQVMETVLICAIIPMEVTCACVKLDLAYLQTTKHVLVRAM